MAIHIYHPNKAVKGFACSFWKNRDGSLFATLMKQSGWDEKTQNGIFRGSLEDPNKKVNIKLSIVEACAILDCIEKNRAFSTFHTGEEYPKSISFTPWMMNPVAEEGEARPASIHKGYSFSIVIGNKTDTQKNSFYIGLTFPEARLVREYIVHYLHEYFNSNSKSNIQTQEESSEKEEPKLNNYDRPASTNLVDI